MMNLWKIHGSKVTTRIVQYILFGFKIAPIKFRHSLIWELTYCNKKVKEYNTLYILQCINTANEWSKKGCRECVNNNLSDSFINLVLREWIKNKSWLGEGQKVSSTFAVFSIRRKWYVVCKMKWKHLKFSTTLILYTYFEFATAVELYAQEN